MPRAATEILPGSLWRHERLGSVAVYEVVSTNGDTVEVRVRMAPGLPADAVVKFTKAAVAAMQRIERWPDPV